MMEEQVQKKYIHRDFSHSTNELLSFLVERVQENICKELEESHYGLIPADFLCTLLGIRQEATDESTETSEQECTMAEIPEQEEKIPGSDIVVEMIDPNYRVSAGTEHDTVSVPNVNDQRFNQFWKAYPRKMAKTAAKKAWDKIKPNETLFETIMQAIEDQKRGADWKKNNGQFIPYPSTWLNQGQYENEVRADLRATMDNPFDFAFGKEETGVEPDGCSSPIEID